MEDVSFVLMSEKGWKQEPLTGMKLRHYLYISCHDPDTCGQTMTDVQFAVVHFSKWCTMVGLPI